MYGVATRKDAHFFTLTHGMQQITSGCTILELLLRDYNSHTKKE